jgi:PIN domain nuclease of toxin-antitoxin system
MSRSGAPRLVLLDTCAVIWFFGGEPLRGDSQAVITRAAMADGVMISPISAWEIGLLSRPKGGRGFDFRPDPAAWFRAVMARTGVALAALTPDIAIAASQLPEPLHGDPADRLLIATARALGLAIVTRDAKIIAYGEAGHVPVIAC